LYTIRDLTEVHKIKKAAAVVQVVTLLLVSPFCQLLSVWFYTALIALMMLIDNCDRPQHVRLHKL